MQSESVGVIDCGTNTTRLLISGPGGDVVRIAKITGLGRGMGRTGLLRADAIDRVIGALRTFRSELEAHSVVQLRIVATSAARDAANGDDFLDQVGAVLGARPEILSGDDEAALCFAGATGGLEHEGSVMVVDIGGGSTEFSVGRVVDGEPLLLGTVSTDMGSVRFTEEFVEHDPPLPEELSNMLQVIQAHLEDVIRILPAAANSSVVLAVAGTATTVAAVELGLIEYDHGLLDGFVLTRDAAEDVFRTLATEPLVDRVHNPGLESDRADVIVAGSAILVGLMRHFGLASVVVRERDILDGLAVTLKKPQA
ncbi:MAG: exopolyphosphatase [Actinobacteria bacterium]|nr:exopolyphosphatase [Actinomycetota bacterium]